MSTTQIEQETIQELDLEKYLGIDRMAEDREREAQVTTDIEEETPALERREAVE